MKHEFQIVSKMEDFAVSGEVASAYRIAGAGEFRKALPELATGSTAFQTGTKRPQLIPAAVSLKFG